MDPPRKLITFEKNPPKVKPKPEPEVTPDPLLIEVETDCFNILYFEYYAWQKWLDRHPFQ